MQIILIINIIWFTNIQKCPGVKACVALCAVAKEDHSQNASFVCVLLSHGDHEEIYGTDQSVKLETLIGCIKGRCCMSLVGKPKLFFIQVSYSSLAENAASF